MFLEVTTTLKIVELISEKSVLVALSFDTINLDFREGGCIFFDDLIVNCGKINSFKLNREIYSKPDEFIEALEGVEWN